MTRKEAERRVLAHIKFYRKEGETLMYMDALEHEGPDRDDDETTLGDLIDVLNGGPPTTMGQGPAPIETYDLTNDWRFEVYKEGGLFHGNVVSPDGARGSANLAVQQGITSDPEEDIPAPILERVEAIYYDGDYDFTS